MKKLALAILLMVSACNRHDDGKPAGASGNVAADVQAGIDRSVRDVEAAEAAAAAPPPAIPAETRAPAETEGDATP